MGAVEAVCNTDGEVDVLGGTESLIEKSLLRQEEGVGGEPRYVMLVTIQEYAWEKLRESGEAELLRRWHAEYFLALAREEESSLLGGRQTESRRRLEEELDNLRAAWSWSLDRGEVEIAARLSWLLLIFWFIRGTPGEGRRWAEATLAKTGGAAGAIRGRSLAAAGIITFGDGDNERAMPLLEEGARLLRAADEKGPLSLTLAGQGMVALNLGMPEKAAPLLEESLRVGQELGDTFGSITALRVLGNLAYEQGDYVRASQRYGEALQVAREIGDGFNTSETLAVLGDAAAAQGEYSRAIRQYEEAIETARRIGYQAVVVWGLKHLGWLLILQGESEQAVPLLEESVALQKEITGPVAPPGQLIFLYYSLAVALAGCQERLPELLAQIVASGQEQGSTKGLVYCVEAAAVAASVAGEPERAAAFFSAASAYRERAADPIRDLDTLLPLALYERCVQELRGQLTPEAFAAAWEEGTEMGLEVAVRYTLAEQKAPL